jgi:hypothetical protein
MSFFDRIQDFYKSEDKLFPSKVALARDKYFCFESYEIDFQFRKSLWKALIFNYFRDFLSIFFVFNQRRKKHYLIKYMTKATKKIFSNERNWVTLE